MDFLRQINIINPDTDLKLKILLIGAGAIGSSFALIASKMGCSKLEIYDPDRLESHNMPNQIYRLSDEDMFKADALKDIVFQFTGYLPDANSVAFEDQAINADIVVVAVDTMETRKAVWARVKYNPSVRLFIDARMAKEDGRIYAINPCDPDEISFYEGMHHETVEIDCTEKSVIYNVFVLGAFMTDIIKHFAKNQTFPKEMLFNFDTFSVMATFQLPKKR